MDLNIIAITKKKTPNGFIPNLAAGTHASWDRTEAYVGVQVRPRQ